jgi:hypothetical protein
MRVSSTTRKVGPGTSAVVGGKVVRFKLSPAVLIEAWVSPAILEESQMFSATPEFVAEIVESFPVCYPLTELNVIRHARQPS